MGLGPEPRRSDAVARGAGLGPEPLRGAAGASGEGLGPVPRREDAGARAVVAPSLGRSASVAVTRSVAIEVPSPMHRPPLDNPAPSAPLSLFVRAPVGPHSSVPMTALASVAGALAGASGAPPVAARLLVARRQAPCGAAGAAAAGLGGSAAGAGAGPSRRLASALVRHLSCSAGRRRLLARIRERFPLLRFRLFLDERRRCPSSARPAASRWGCSVSIDDSPNPSWTPAWTKMRAPLALAVLAKGKHSPRSVASDGSGTISPGLLTALLALGVEIDRER